MSENIENLQNSGSQDNSVKVESPKGAPSARTTSGATGQAFVKTGTYSRENGFRKFGSTTSSSSRTARSSSVAGGSTSEASKSSGNSWNNERKPFGERRRSGTAGGANKSRGKFGRTPRKEEDESNLQSTVITVKRITRVVKGGKRMRFAALVVSGDKAGSVGYGFKKGLDYQDAVKKATKQAGKNLLKVKINENKSIDFPTDLKFKAAKIFLKPAFVGTGLIAGGFIRPVLELAGIENIYSKIIGSRNKVTGVQATFEALKKYS